MSKKALIIVIAVVQLLPATASAWITRTKLLKIRPICGKYQIESKAPLAFNGNEKKLICGDDKVKAWKNIPESQAKYNIKNFLQNRGYYYPKFRAAGDMITIVPGEPTEIKEIVLEGNYPKSLKVRRRRKIMHTAMTPAKLTTLSDWVTAELNNSGYPCAKAKAEVEAYSGKVYLKIDSKDYFNLEEISETPLKGLRPGVLRRYDAFKLGKPYSLKLLNLTSRRIEENGIVQNSYFTTTCKGTDGVKVNEVTGLGKPHLFIAGVGFNTEEYVKGKISWKHTRMDTKGSSVLIKGIASYRRQKASAEMHWYAFPRPSRWNIHPGASIDRRFERKYEYLKETGYFHLNRTWDTERLAMELNFGPDIGYTKTYKGANRGFTHFLSGNVEFDVASHDYELYSYDPRSGYTLDFSSSLNNEAVYSSVTAQQLELSGQWLINIGKFDPTLLVLGLRGTVNTTITNRNSPNFNNLPPEYLFYLGGSRDLRGFKRQELPLTYSGSLTSAYTSVELRLTNTLPFGIQPITFVDVGALGRTSFNLDYPIYWSPGFGMRFYSVFGVFRTTMAHGFMIKNSNPGNNPASHWQFYFSYGEEF